jgi:hypothetical protein
MAQTEKERRREKEKERRMRFRSLKQQTAPADVLMVISR